MANSTIKLLDYHIVEELHKEQNMTLVSAVHEARSIILRLIPLNGFKNTDRDKIDNEFAWASNFRFYRVLNQLGFRRSELYHILELEGFDGISLESYLLNNKLSVFSAITLAEELTLVVEELQYHGINHFDLRPAHFLVNPENNELKLMDLSNAVPENGVNDENSRRGLEIGLHYISPEQSGLTDVPIDYRSDYYHLGVMFYRLFTGHLPFESTDPNELVHGHIARTPVSPANSLSAVPLPVSRIIMKLLSKKPEDRYQTTRGIRYDLSLFKNMDTGDFASFLPGFRDLAGQFVLPDRLYGRDGDLSLILDKFGRIREGNELVLVSGHSGIGKSSLIEDVKKRLERVGALFVAGKFDQYVQNIPFEGVIKALKDLVTKISGKNLRYWRASIQNAVGSQGQIIIDVIPELEEIIGHQHAVEVLPPLETQNRFINVFTNFINVFTKSEHPLVIFLDDLQWADPSSLIFLSRVVESVEGSNFLLIGTYRDNEVTDTHPLKHVIRGLEEGRTTLSQISLSPLQVGDISLMLADILSSTPVCVEPFAEVMMGVTLGNPLFIAETLYDFYQLGFIEYNRKWRKWVWDLEQIGGHSRSISSQQLLTSKINALSQSTGKALITASCIGSEFDLPLLSALQDKTPQETEEDLRDAIIENLIVSVDDGSSGRYLVTNRYRFVHDQVQQAANEMLTAEEQDDLHVNIGYFLLEKLSNEERNRRLFEVVNHLNHHIAVFTVPSERLRIIKLNIDAGKKAKESTSYSVALTYFQKGRDLLKVEDWQDAYDLTFDLNLQYAECAYLSGHQEVCLQTVAEALPYTKSVIDKTELHQVEIQCLIVNEELEKAIEVSFRVLNVLGISFPRWPWGIHARMSYLKSKWVLRDKKIEDLSELGKMVDPLKKASMRVLQNILTPVSAKRPALYPLIVIKMLELSVKYGITVESGFTLSTYGAMVGVVENNIDACYRFGGAALKIAEQFGSGIARDRTIYFYNIINRPFSENINNTLGPLKRSYQASIDLGDMEYCTYASSTYCYYLLLSGRNLHWVKEEMIQFNQPPKALSRYHPTYKNESMIQLVSNLLGENPNSFETKGEHFDEGVDFSAIFALKNNIRIFVYLVSKMMLSYLDGELGHCLKLVGYVTPFREDFFLKGTPFEPLFSFYHGLLCVSMFRDGGGRGSYLKTAKLERDRMRKWANQVPINFAHRYHLMEAEIFAIQGKIERALEHYDLSIKTALTNEHPHEAAIANELCGRYWLDRGQLKTGMIYIKASYAGYQEWGCVIKERQLLKAFPELGHLDAQPGIYHFLTGGDSIASTLDLSTLMKASTAISGEVVFDRLMKKLMQFAIENAGAQSGYFILDWDGALFIEAQHSVIGELGDIRRIPLTESDQVPTSIIAHVFGTKMDVVLHDAQTSELFKSDPVVITKGIRSALCIPALNQGKILGVLYLENNLSTSVFTNERTQLLKLLSGQIAVSIENAILYEKLEQKVAVRTAEIETQKEEIERQRQLVEEKSRFKEQFFANMSHEIRTPMTAILGMSDLIFDTPLNTKQLEYAKGIRYSSENLLAIINDILDYSKIEAGKFSFVNKPFQIRDRMERLGYVLRLIAKEKGLELDIDVENDVSPQLIGDPIRLHQVLLNLASNALKFTDTGSVSLNISVSTRKGTHEELLFRVTDTGIGIAEEKLDYIFETFTRIDEELNNSQSGTGLGLFIAKKLVEEQGGEMKVSSQLGQGTEFSFKLEFEICHVDGVQAETDEGPLSSGLKVLLVEDNLFNQVVAEETLKKLIRDVQVTVADNGQIALQKLVEGEFDIVLMDVKMPVMDGYKATRAIRAKETTTRVPILAFTSNANPKEFQKCLDAGMDDYITKPIEAQKLKNKIRKLTDNTKRSNSTS